MSLENLAIDVESIALSLSEEGGYEYYRVDDDLKELAKNVSDMQAENAKLRELVRDMYGFIQSMDEDYGDVIFSDCFDYCKHEAADDGCRKIGKCWYDRRMHELGVEVDE